MPVSELHARVASIALDAAAEHGFALGGGNALLAHGIINRRTLDVDLFTDHELGVEHAADGVEAALHDAGFQAERIDKTAGLADIFEGMGEGLAEWAVTAPSGEKMALQMAYFERGRQPVIMEIGPVLDLEDAAGGKVAALASRIEPRDYADTAAMLDHYSPAELLGFARRVDPGLTGRDYAAAGQQLDRWGDEVFTAAGLSPQDITTLRERFAGWPRDAEAADRQLPVAEPEERGRQHEQLPDPAREEPEQAAEPVPARTDPGQEHAPRRVIQESPGSAPGPDERDISQDDPSPTQEADAGQQLEALTEDLQRADATLRRIQARQAERAGQEAEADDDRRREHYRAADQQPQEERAAEPERDGPEIEP
jgi:hypothetical protein